MSSIDPTTHPRERPADEAREALTKDLAGISDRAHSTVAKMDALARRGRSAAALIAAGAGIATIAALALPRRTVTRLAARTTLGTLAGIAAGLTMNEFHSLWSAVARRLGPQSKESKGEPATVKAAEAIVGPVDDARKARAGNVAHYMMSALTGTAYALAAERIPSVTRGRGIPYGAGVWLAADELMVPALGLAPWRAPVSAHVRGLLAHLAYGASLDLALRVMRRATVDR
jgi:hypothetical protein